MFLDLILFTFVFQVYIKLVIIPLSFLRIIFNYVICALTLIIGFVWIYLPLRAHVKTCSIYLIIIMQLMTNYNYFLWLCRSKFWEISNQHNLRTQRWSLLRHKRSNIFSQNSLLSLACFNPDDPNFDRRLRSRVSILHSHRYPLQRRNQLAPTH